jgi:hypothetical protein
VKILNYTLAAVIGAVIASQVTYRLFKHTMDAAPEPPPVVRVVERPQPAPGPSPVELERLNRENADLSAQLEDARSRLTETDAALAQTKGNLEELRRPMSADILSSAVRAELKSGEVVVTGGYKLPDGRRIYAFAQPVVEQVDGVETVKVTGRFLSLTDEAGTAVGLDSIATNAANTLQHGEVWVADEQQAVLTKLSGNAGADLLTMPEITLGSGASGSVEMGDLRLKITPTLTVGGENMDFEMRLEQPLPTPVDSTATTTATAPAVVAPQAE